MAIDSKHPDYHEFLPDWLAMRDTFRGERVVKARGVTYLPATRSMELDGMTPGQIGWSCYQAYRTRAVFNNFVGEGIETLLGMMWMKPPTISLPEAMEPMREKATVKSESMEMILRRINEEQLITGRLGIMLDLPLGESLDTEIMPYIAMYTAERVINWDDGTTEELVLQNLNFVALDESEQERDNDFEWEQEPKTRILLLGDAESNEGVGGGVYKQGLFRDEQAGFDESMMMTPRFRGQTLDEIPFVFVNAKDITVDPDDPPLLDLARLCLAIYRGEADYRQSLFLQGQDTLVVIGGTSGDDVTYRTGAGASINLSQGGDAKFIGVDSSGLSEQREALQNDKMIAAKKSGSMAQKGAQVESGDAMRIRFGATTASLTQIALTGAFALQTLLRIQAKWMRLDPEQVIVVPNLDFTDERMEPKSLVELTSAKTMGAPIADKTIHDRMRERGLTDLEYEDELQLIEEEEPRGASGVELGVEEETDESTLAEETSEEEEE